MARPLQDISMHGCLHRSSQSPLLEAARNTVTQQRWADYWAYTHRQFNTHDHIVFLYEGGRWAYANWFNFNEGKTRSRSITMWQIWGRVVLISRQGEEVFVSQRNTVLSKMHTTTSWEREHYFEIFSFHQTYNVSRRIMVIDMASNFWNASNANGTRYNPNGNNP